MTLEKINEIVWAVAFGLWFGLGTAYVVEKHYEKIHTIEVENNCTWNYRSEWCE